MSDLVMNFKLEAEILKENITEKANIQSQGSHTEAANHHGTDQ